MSVKLRSAIASTGPRSGSSWFTAGENVGPVATATVNASQTFTASVGTSEAVLFTVPTPASNIFGGGYTDVAESDAFVAYLSQIQITAGGTALAVNTANLTLGFNLRRAGLVIGGGIFAGWAAAANAALPAFTPVTVPFVTTNTALIGAGGATLAAGNALLPLKAADVITLSMVVASANVTTMPFMTISLDLA